MSKSFEPEDDVWKRYHPSWRGTDENGERFILLSAGDCYKRVYVKDIARLERVESMTGKSREEAAQIAREYGG